MNRIVLIFIIILICSCSHVKNINDDPVFLEKCTESSCKNHEDYQRLLQTISEIVGNGNIEYKFSTIDEKLSDILHRNIEIKCILNELCFISKKRKLSEYSYRYLKVSTIISYYDYKIYLCENKEGQDILASQLEDILTAYLNNKPDITSVYSRLASQLIQSSNSKEKIQVKNKNIIIQFFSKAISEYKQIIKKRSNSIDEKTINSNWYFTDLYKEDYEFQHIDSKYIQTLNELGRLYLYHKDIYNAKKYFDKMFNAILSRSSRVGNGYYGFHNLLSDLVYINILLGKIDEAKSIVTKIHEEENCDNYEYEDCH